MPVSPKRHLALFVLAILLMISSGCGVPSAAPKTASPSPSSAPTSSPLPPSPVAASPTPSLTPVTPTAQPVIDLPVGTGSSYPIPSVILGATDDQVPAELARWGRGMLNQLAVSPDETSIAAAATSGVYFYDSKTFELVHAKLTSSSAAAIQFSPDGRLLAAAIRNSVLVWQVSDGALLYTLETGVTPKPGDQPVDFSPDGKSLATVTSSSIKIWEAGSGNLTKEIPLPVENGNSPASVHYLDANSLFVYIYGVNSIFQKLEIPSGKTVYSSALSSHPAQWILSASGKYSAIVDNAKPASMKIFETGAGKQIAQIPLNNYVSDIHFSPDDNLFSVNFSQKTCTWQLPTGNALPCIDTSYSSSTAFLSDDKRLLVKSNYSYSIVDALTGKSTGSIPKDPAAAKFYPNDVLLVDHGKVYLHDFRTITVWTEDGSPVGKFPGFDYVNNFNTITLLPAGSGLPDNPAPQDLFILGNRNGMVTALDAHTGESVNYAKGKPISQVVISPDRTISADLEYKFDKKVYALILTNPNLNSPITLLEVKTQWDLSSLALSADGRLLATCIYLTDASEVRLWDTTTGDLKASISLPGAASAGLAISPDAKTLAVTGGDSQEILLIYDVSDPAHPLKTLSLSSTEVGYAHSLAFTPDGKALAVGEGAGKVTFIATTDWKTPLFKFDTGIRHNSIAFLNDGKVLAIAGQDGLLHLWGVPPPGYGGQIAQATSTPAPQVAKASKPLSYAGTPYPTPASAFNSDSSAHVVELALWGKGNISSMVVSPDGKRAALVTSIGVYLYDALSLKPQGTIESALPVDGARFSPDGSLLAIRTYDSGIVTISVWSVADSSGAGSPGAENKPMFVQQASVTRFNPNEINFDFSPDGKTFAALSESDVVFMEAQTGKITGHAPLPIDLTPSALRYAPGGQALIVMAFGSAGWTGLRWLDLASQKFGAEAKIPQNRNVAFSPDGKIVAAGAGDYTGKTSSVQFFDAASGSPIGTVINPGAEVLALQFTPASDQLAISSADGRLCLYQVPDGALLKCLVEKGGATPSSIRFSNDGKYLIGSGSALPMVWDTTDWSRFQDPNTNPTNDYVRQLEILPGSGGVLVLNDTGVTRWNIGSSIRFRQTLPGEAVALAYSTDMKTLTAAGSWGIQTWDGDTGSPLDKIADGAQTLAFSDDSKTLAAARADGTVALYTLPGGTLLRTLDGLKNPAVHLAFIQDGNVLVAASDTETRLWKISDGSAYPAPQMDPGGILLIADGQNLQHPGEWLGIDKDLTGHFWKVEDGKPTLIDPSLKGKVKNVRSILLVNGQLIVLSDSMVTLFNQFGYKQWETPLAISDPATLSISLDGYLAVSGKDGAVILNQKGGIIRKYPGPISAMGFGNASAVLAISAGNELQVWNNSLGPVAGALDFSPAGPTTFRLAYLPKPQIVFKELPDQPLILWMSFNSFRALDVTNGTLVSTFQANVQEVASTPDMAVQAYLMPNTKVVIARTSSKQIDVQTKTSMITSGLSLSADGKLLSAIVYMNQVSDITIWNAAAGASLATIKGDKIGYSSAVLSPDGKFLAAVTRNGEAHIYDLSQVANPKLVKTIKMDGECLAFSPDGLVLAVGDTKGKVTLLDVRNGWENRISFKAHSSGIQSMVFLPDGKTLATAGEDGTVRLWGVVN